MGYDRHGFCYVFCYLIFFEKADRGMSQYPWIIFHAMLMRIRVWRRLDFSLHIFSMSKGVITITPILIIRFISFIFLFFLLLRRFKSHGNWNQNWNDVMILDDVLLV